jgi:putative alpha-1,2-mannosidase
VEYAYDDFCIAEMAKGLGKTADYEKYTRRSSNWENMFNPDQTSFINGTDTGFVGFLQPKFLNQTWGYQDPILCSPLLNFTSCYLNPNGHETYEGSSWMYTFFAPGDMASLITTLGGPQTFVKRLDYLHESGLLYIGDEQAFLNVFLYHYAARPGLSRRPHPLLHPVPVQRHTGRHPRERRQRRHGLICGAHAARYIPEPRAGRLSHHATVLQVCGYHESADGQKGDY